jgi:hypothetical protein
MMPDHAQARLAPIGRSVRAGVAFGDVMVSSVTGWVRRPRTRVGRFWSWLWSSTPRQPWPEDEYHCPRCERPIPGSYYTGRTPLAIAIKPTDAEVARRCLVCGRLGAMDVPAAHDRAWVLAEAESFGDELRDNHRRGWAREIDKGIRRAQDGSLDYLGHAVHQARSAMGRPDRIDTDRLDQLLAAIGRLW